jgi:hypothetical protein
MSILRSRVPPPRLSARLPKRYQRPQASPPGFYDARPAWAVAPWPAEEAAAPAWSVRLPSGREHAVFDLTWLKLVRTAVVDAGEGIAEVVG